MSNVQVGLHGLAAYLRPHVGTAAMREARILLAHVMDVSPDRMTLMAQNALEGDVLEQAYTQARRRAVGEPISHIVGYRDFYGRRFDVDARVLDPRPETEELIAAALSEPFDSVLDLGTGSGAIVATLMADRTDATGIATDVSKQAIEVAQKNAQKLGLVDRIEFVVSDWFATVEGEYDLVVSNPPYIAADEMDSLQSGVRDFEPRIALTDEADGLSCYRKIVGGYDPHLRPMGRLMVEIGPTQAGAVTDMMTHAGLTDVTVIPDLDGRDRVVWGRKPHKSA